MPQHRTRPSARPHLRPLPADPSLPWRVSLSNFPHPSLATASAVGRFAPTFLLAAVIVNMVVLLTAMVRRGRGRVCGGGMWEEGCGRRGVGAEEVCAVGGGVCAAWGYFDVAAHEPVLAGELWIWYSIRFKIVICEISVLTVCPTPASASSQYNMSCCGHSPAPPPCVAAGGGAREWHARRSHSHGAARLGALGERVCVYVCVTVCVTVCVCVCVCVCDGVCVCV